MPSLLKCDDAGTARGLSGTITGGWSGKVIGKYEKDDEHIIACEVWTENRLGQRTISGNAIVCILSRS